MAKTHKAFLVVSIMLLFICFYAYAQENDGLSRIEQIMEVMIAEQIELSEWSIYAKRPIHDKSSVMTRLDDFAWKQLDANTAQGTYEHPEIRMKEFVTIMKKQHSPEYLLTYEVSGTSFQKEHWSDAKTIIAKKQRILFESEIEPFARVRGRTIKEDSRHAEELSYVLLRNLHGKEVESLAEEDFLAVSAFRKDWPNTLVTGAGKMNIQLGIRTNHDSNGIKTVTLGTPIITTEY